jgi:putative DNA primase/helicase
MSNDSTKTIPAQKRNSPTEELKTVQDSLDQEFGLIINRMSKLGLGDNPEDLQSISPDIDNAPESAQEIIDLKTDYQIWLQKKQTIINTICIEPSKLHENVNAAEELLIRHRKCDVYQRAGKLVRITHSEPQSKGTVKRPHNATVIKEIDQTYLTLLLTKLGAFVRLDGRSGNLNNIDCPEKIARSLIAKHEWNLPLLKGIINTPTLRPDGSILDKPGYDESSETFFISGNTNFEKIPEQPTKNEIVDAKAALLSILKDFPFEDEVSRSVVIAAILTALIRKSLSTAPLFGFSAPKMSSGKSLLTDVVSLIATGKSNSVIAQSENEAEEKKRILAMLMEGDLIICYDNIEKPFGNATLCAILTQQYYKDRLLGESETRTVLTNTTFLANGNNLIFKGDISTRTLLCKLDPEIERPEERSFDIDLREYIPTHRGQLVKAALTLLRAYHVAGRPKQGIKQFGRFEEWSDWVRSTIVWIGMPDPCESRKGIEDEDPTHILLEALLSSWHEIFGERSIKIRELISGSQANENLKDYLLELAPDGKVGINSRTLAKKLVSFNKRIEGGLRLEKGEKNQGTHLWRVKKSK